MGNISDENYKGKKKAMSFKEALIAAQLAEFDFPYVVAAQFALETGYGTATASAKNNFFNIKWDDTAAAKLIANKINVTKGTELVKDKVTGEEDYYMAFETPQDAFHGLKMFLETNPRYDKAGLFEATTEEEYIKALQRAGYAQDKNYVNKIQGFIQQAKDEDITLFTPEDQAKLEEDYINPEQIKKDVALKNLTPKQKELKEKEKEYTEKLKTFKAAQDNYQKIIKSDNVKVEEVDKAKKAFKDAYIDIYNDSQKLVYDVNKEIYDKAKKDTDPKTGFLKGTKRYREAEMEIEYYERGAGIAGKDLYPIFEEGTIQGARGKSYKGKVPKKVTKDSKTLAEEFDQLTEDSWFLKDIFNRRELNEINKQAQFINENLTKKIGENIEYDPKVKEEIDQEIKRREQEVALTQKKKDEWVETVKQVSVNNLDTKEKNDVLKQRAAEEEAIRRAEEAQKRLDDAQAYKKMKADADDYMSRFDDPPELIVPDEFVYDKSDYKRELPLEALGYGLLGLQGLSNAKTPLPMRDEKVSQALLQYTADLKHMSQQGLKPEEEAKLKDQLAGVYSQGLNQLVRASGGDRNVVLGNMQGLQNAKMRGLTDMAIADVNIKQQNFEKYGEAIKELNAFRMTKDIANHAIKLDEAKTKRQGGAALASSGFATMLEEIQYQKENGPGSANHRLHKAFEINLTGVDSERPDDGRAFTASGNANRLNELLMKREAVISGNEKQRNSIKEFQSLSQDEALRFRSFQDYLNQKEELSKQQEQPQAQSNQSSYDDRWGW